MYYTIFEETVGNLETGEYVTYGIRAYQAKTLIVTVHDISTNQEYVQTLCNKYNRHGLSAIHLKDVIEDDLGE